MGVFKKKNGSKQESSEEVTPDVAETDITLSNILGETGKEITIGLIKEEDFGVLLPMIKNEDITDINWNGTQLWIDDIRKGRYLSEVVLSDVFIGEFSTRISNVVSKAFNKYNPVLEAETDTLRISIVHESYAHTGRAISIRKTPAVKRINWDNSFKNGSYCPEEVGYLLANMVKAKSNIVVCGLPGVGKTELVKFLTGFIEETQRVITIEDSLEIHYSEINKGKDCVELKVGENFSYTDAIKACLRLRPDWIVLSEARSLEVKYLLESLSTGTNCLTTIHTDDVRKLPDRIKNMIGDNIASDRVENEVYSFIDMAILIDRVIVDGRIERRVAQVGTFSRDGIENHCSVIYNDGKLDKGSLQTSIRNKLAMRGIKDPFKLG